MGRGVLSGHADHTSWWVSSTNHQEASSFITKINFSLKGFQKKGKYRTEQPELEMEESFRIYVPQRQRTNGISTSFKQTRYLGCVEKNSGSNMENVSEKTESKKDRPCGILVRGPELKHCKKEKREILNTYFTGEPQKTLYLTLCRCLPLWLMTKYSNVKNLNYTQRERICLVWERRPHCVEKMHRISS